MLQCGRYLEDRRTLGPRPSLSVILAPGRPLSAETVGADKGNWTHVQYQGYIHQEFICASLQGFILVLAPLKNKACTYLFLKEFWVAIGLLILFFFS